MKFLQFIPLKNITALEGTTSIDLDVVSHLDSEPIENIIENVINEVEIYDSLSIRVTLNSDSII